MSYLGPLKFNIRYTVVKIFDNHNNVVFFGHDTTNRKETKLILWKKDFINKAPTIAYQKYLDNAKLRVTQQNIELVASSVRHYKGSPERTILDFILPDWRPPFTTHSPKDPFPFDEDGLEEMQTPAMPDDDDDILTFSRAQFRKELKRSFDNQ